MASYTVTKADARDPFACIAYIDSDGDLRVRGPLRAVAIRMDLESHSAPAAPDVGWHPEVGDVRQRFYPGDSITITF